MGCGISHLPKILDSNSQKGSPDRTSGHETLKHLLEESHEYFSSSDGGLDHQLFQRTNILRGSTSSSSSHDIHFHKEQQIIEVNDNRQYSVALLDPKDAIEGKLDSTSDAESGIELTDHKNSEGAFIGEECIPPKPLRVTQFEEAQISIVEVEDDEENENQSRHESPNHDIFSELKSEEVSSIQNLGDVQNPLNMEEARTSSLIVNYEEEIEEESNPEELVNLPEISTHEKESYKDLSITQTTLEKYDPGNPNESKLHADAGSLILDMEPLNLEHDSEEIIVVEEDNEFSSFTDLEIIETEIHTIVNEAV
ncbi:unnamed protein product [Lepeophtheirus salmonis]|uniref:(salmon louse) hypothetical protein n=1 Tax=Lepeophtheirus salmonis TaxID=72036 RepID=A0A7R8CAU8_LEPSM|nr:unnamed protein product [Lepeophtheirus salmonis]CAF2753205.1 unnamed protein product [Lepeophtheirus salmonis]